MIIALAKADQGVDRVIDWVCRSRPSSAARFSPHDLHRVLCDSFVTIPLDERESLEAFEPSEELANINEVLMDVLSQLVGRPRTVDFFLEEDELLKKFAGRWPDQQHRFRKTIKSRTRNCREQIAASLKLIDQLTEHQETWETEWEPPSAAPLGVSLDDAGYTPAAEFLREEIQRQQQSTRGRKELAKQMGQMIRRGLATNVKFREFLFEANRDKLLDRIGLASAEHGFVVTEAAWRAIAQEATLDELRYLAVLALLGLHEESFWHWRRHLLHSPDLWPLLAAAATS